MMFSSPVNTSASTTYTATVDRANSYYPLTSSYFTAPITRGIITAPTGAGVYGSPGNTQADTAILRHTFFRDVQLGHYLNTGHQQTG